MQNRVSDWQLTDEETKALPGVENCLYELALEDGSVERDRRAVIFAKQVDAQLSAYVIAEAATRRRNMMQIYGLDYYTLEHRVKLAAAFDITIEQAGYIHAYSSVLWFCVVAPVLHDREEISVEIILMISEYITGKHVTKHDVDDVTAAVRRKISLFAPRPLPLNDNSHDVQEMKPSK